MREAIIVVFVFLVVGGICANPPVIYPDGLSEVLKAGTVDGDTKYVPDRDSLDRESLEYFAATEFVELIDKFGDKLVLALNDINAPMIEWNQEQFESGEVPDIDSRRFQEIGNMCKILHERPIKGGDSTVSLKTRVPLHEVSHSAQEEYFLVEIETHRKGGVYRTYFFVSEFLTYFMNDKNSPWRNAPIAFQRVIGGKRSVKANQ